MARLFDDFPAMGAPEIDPALMGLLEVLRPVPSRDARAASRGHEKFLVEAEALGFSVQPSRLVSFVHSLPVTRPLEKRSKPRAERRASLVRNFLVAALVVLLLLAGSARITSYASQSALPGDALYPVKTTFENTQLALSGDAARQAQLHLSFAQRRLDEIGALIASGRFAEVKPLTIVFEYHIQQAIDRLQIVARGDPQQAVLLTAQISAALTRYAQTLSGLLASVPDSVRPAVQQAIDASDRVDSFSQEVEIEFSGPVESMAPQTWVVGGHTLAITPQTEIKGEIQTGDQVEVHAFQGSGGELAAREIELVETEDNEAAPVQIEDIPEANDREDHEDGQDRQGEESASGEQDDQEAVENDEGEHHLDHEDEHHGDKPDKKGGEDGEHDDGEGENGGDSHGDD